MRRRRFAVLGLALMASLVVGVPPAAAHQGHESCRAAGQLAASEAQAGGAAFGAEVSGFARAGVVNDVVALIHATVCEPHP